MNSDEHKGEHMDLTALLRNLMSQYQENLNQANEQRLLALGAIQAIGEVAKAIHEAAMAETQGEVKEE